MHNRTFPDILCSTTIVQNSSQDYTILALEFSSTYILFITSVFMLKGVVSFFKRRRFSLEAKLERSILGGFRWENKYITIVLYYFLVYGPFYFKLADAVLAILLHRCAESNATDGVLAFVLDLLLDSSNFFSIMFVINLYGYKWEILMRYGYPVIPDSEKKNFVRLCLKKSVMFSLIYAIMYVFFESIFDQNRTSFDYFQYFSFYKLLKNMMMCTLIFQRFRLVNYYREVIRSTKLSERQTEELNIYIKTIIDQFPTDGDITEAIMDCTSHENVQLWLIMRIENVKYIINERLRVLNLNYKQYRAPIPRNYKERYCTNKLLLYWLLFDTVVYTLGCCYLALEGAIMKGGDKPETDIRD